MLFRSWEYLSALSTVYPLKPYRPSDDLESFMHVLRKLAARFHHSHKSGYSAHNTRGMLEMSFRPYTDAFQERNFLVADWPRVERIASGWAPVVLTHGRNSEAFVELIEKLTRLCADYYIEALDLDKIKALYDIPRLDADPDSDGVDGGVDDFYFQWDDGLSIRPGVQFKFDHDAFLGLFDKALENEAAWKADKIEDQMYATTNLHGSQPGRFSVPALGYQERQAADSGRKRKRGGLKYAAQ